MILKPIVPTENPERIPMTNRFVRTFDRQHVAYKRNFEFYDRLEVKVLLLNFIEDF